MNESQAAVLFSLALELGPLAELRGWVVVGEKLETFADTIRGHGGLTDSEINRMRKWARRWKSISPSLRKFYAEQTHRETIHPCVSSALWYMLESSGPPLSGKQYAVLRSIWISEYGIEPSLELAPNLDAT